MWNCLSSFALVKPFPNWASELTHLSMTSLITCDSFNRMRSMSVRRSAPLATTTSPESLSYTLRLSVITQPLMWFTVSWTFRILTGYPNNSDNWNRAKNKRSSPLTAATASLAPGLEQTLLIFEECQAIRLTSVHCPCNKRLEAAPMQIPWVLPPSMRFWDAASAQAKRPISSTGMEWINNLWSFMPLTWSKRWFALIRVSTQLLFTSESMSPTSAEKCGATCWACQLMAPSRARSCDFSKSSVSAWRSLRRCARMLICLMPSTYLSWDSAYPPFWSLSTCTPHWVKRSCSQSPQRYCCLICSIVLIHTGSSSEPENRKSSIWPDMIPWSWFSFTSIQLHGSAQHLLRPMRPKKSQMDRYHSKGASTRP